MFITNIVKLVIKYVFLRDSPSEILKEIYVMMLKITLTIFGSMLTTRKTNVIIPQLYKPNTNKKVYCEIDYDKAEAFASQFNSVFTIEKENTWNIYLIVNLLSVLMLQPY